MSIVDEPGGDTRVRLRDIPRYPADTAAGLIVILIGSISLLSSAADPTPLFWRPVYWLLGVAAMLIGLHDLDRTLRRVNDVA